MYGYGNEQAMMTMNRAAYGDIPAAMMGGSYGGAPQGLQNMMSDVGRVVMPVGYSAPLRPMVGFYGAYPQNTGFLGGAAATLGFTTVPRGTSALNYIHNASGDFGERLGGGLVGAAASAGGLAFGATAGYGIGGFMGAAAGSVFGPVGTAVGGWLGANIGGYAMGMAGAGSITKAVEERRQIQSFLEQSSFRFVGSGSSMVDPVLGAGMSRGARQDMSEFIRGMDIRDKTLNMGDLSQILKQGTQLGLFNGTQDMQDFQRKFKDITESVKTVTKVLNQTLEEGMKTLADLRGIGIDPSRARSVVSQASSLGSVAGRTGQEMIGLGLQGAEMFRGTGVTMGIGFQASQMNLAAVRAARDFGTLSQEAISQAGGEEALALRMAAGGLSFAQSAMGRGYGAAFFQPGAPGGGLNAQTFMQNMMGGGGNFLQMIQTGATNLSSPSRLIAYQANQERFMSQMGQQFGGRGLEMAMLGSTAAYAEYMSNSIGDPSQKENFFRLSLKQQGKSQSEIDAYLSQIKDPEKMFKTMQAGVEATANKMKLDEASENFILNRVGAAVGDRVKGVIDLAAAPLNRVVDNVAQGVQTFTREQIYGAVSGSARGVDLSVLGPVSAADKAQAQAAAGPTNMDTKSMFAKSAGEKLLGALQAPGMAEMLGVSVRTVADKAELTADDVILNEGGLLGGTKVVSKAELAKAGRQAQVLNMSMAEAEAINKSGNLEAMAKMSGGSTLMDIIAKGKLGGITDAKSLFKAMTGTTAVNENQMAFVMTQVKGTQFEKMIDEARSNIGVVASQASNVGIADLRQSRQVFDKAKEQLEDTTGFKLAEGVAERLAMAKQATDPKERLRLRDEATKLQLQAGGDMRPADVQRKLDEAFALESTALKDVHKGMVGIQAAQQSRGAGVLSSALAQTLISAEGVDLKFDVRSEISNAAMVLGSGSVKNIRELIKDKKAMEAIKQTGSGAAIAGRLEGIAAIDALSTTASDKDIREAFSKVYRDESSLQNAIIQFKEKGPSAAASEAIKAFESEVTTQSGIMSASGTGSTSGDPNVKNAEQMAITQTNINLQTLSAMQALAAKLGVR